MYNLSELQHLRTHGQPANKIPGRTEEKEQKNSAKYRGLDKRELSLCKTQQTDLKKLFMRLLPPGSSITTPLHKTRPLFKKILTRVGSHQPANHTLRGGDGEGGRGLTR